MRMIDLIEKKKQGLCLSDDEITWMIDGYVAGDIPDYQMSAFLMAVCFNGLDENETTTLTKAMMMSGDVIDLSAIDGLKADKHSTGGVGDKTSLVLTPMVAATGVPVAKMSGRGLGHTGGTLDKLESIPGFNIYLTTDQFIEQVKDIHLAIIGQTAELVPADRKLYALRDVTATVDSIPLIASSIMSKKLAAGSDAIVLDVKYGNGAFMTTIDDARVLAGEMIRIGESLGRKVEAVISAMGQPLGRAVGNILEVKEAVNALRGDGPDDLMDLCLSAGAELLVMTERCHDTKEARALLIEMIDSGKALEAFRQMVIRQGGDVRYIDNPDLFDTAKEVIAVKAEKDGIIADLHARDLGLASMMLGGGRRVKDDVIDPTVGLILTKKIGDSVCAGDTLVEVHTNTGLSDEVKHLILGACTLGGDGRSMPVIEEIVKGDE